MVNYPERRFAMSKDKFPVKIEYVRMSLPKRCTCPACGMNQDFRKHSVWWKKVKDISLEKPRMLLVERVRAKCTNPNCPKCTFVLPSSITIKYQRTTFRLQKEVIDENLDNVTYRKIASKLTRTFNTTGAKSTVDDWKQREAEKFSFKDIIKAMRFSGSLSIDEYKPSRSKHYDIIAADAKKVRILYIETAPFSPRHAGTLARGDIEGFCWKLYEFGITNPKVVIVDLLKAYPKQIKKVWPNALIQFDYFHVMQVIYKHLKQLLFGFIRNLRKEDPLAAEELWEYRWRILRNMEKWNTKDHEIVPRLMEIYADTPIEQILLFKERLHDIFNLSKSKQEAYEKRNILFNETWWRNSWHLTQAMRFLMRPDFDYMVTYLDNPGIPRCGNLETLIRSWRQLEKIRYGFASEKGRQNHLKLYQIKHYLKGHSSQNFG